MARFKCKKCKKSFNLKDGREAIQEAVDGCQKTGCQLRHKKLDYIPLKSHTLKIMDSIWQKPLALPAPKEEEEIIVYEEQPIGGFISQKEIRKKHGRK